MKIIAIGGGTGLPLVLKGLKNHLYSHNGKARRNGLTAIVAATDDGGSSGRLKRDLNILPPGDIRNCLVALANTDSILPDLFQYRFARGRGLNKHSMGNLFLAALSELTQDFEYAINTTARLLDISGRVLPSTLERVELGARLKDRRVVWGQTAITKNGNAIEEVFLRPKNPSPVPTALDAIANADAILLGPGSLYTSLIPNLLVKGIVEAISKSSAKKILVMNLMTQPGETDGYTAEDHLDAIVRHCGQQIFDYVILNNRAFQGGNLKGATPVIYDSRRIAENKAVVPIEQDVASETMKTCHDPDRLAQIILNIICKNDSEAELNADKAETSGRKTSSNNVTKLGRIPININLSETCIDCLWFERSKNGNQCANEETLICAFHRKEILKNREME